MRTAYDLSPLYCSMIGADHMAGMLESALNGAASRDYPPYDIEKTGEQAYRITVATAGFREDELEIVAQPNLLVVRGRKAQAPNADRFLHHGLAQRPFEHRFELADYIVVRAAHYADGLLTVELEREVPEALKPRRIEIRTPATPAAAISRLSPAGRRSQKAA
ncbi:MAG: Hsp20 family protein [Proteobacteria bacterium]|nr:Hsp20 family protein [Pseudomonadota bacterium]